MDQSIKKPVKSSFLKCGKRTFFFDVNVASNNKKYLKITESQLLGKGTDRKRSSFLLFGEEILHFQEKLTEIAGHLA